MNSAYLNGGSPNSKAMFNIGVCTEKRRLQARDAITEMFQPFSKGKDHLNHLLFPSA